MLELYLFIFALVAITLLLVRRFLIIQNKERKEFRKQVAEKVEENRKIEKEQESVRFKEVHMQEAGSKKYDHARFKEEMRKAEMAISKNNLSEAKKALIQAMSLTENEAEVAQKLAAVYLDTGDLKRAEMMYRKLLEGNPQSAELYERLGQIMLKKKAYKDAVQAYCRAVELDEKDDQKLLALGNLYHLMMRYGVAGECFKRAAELKPREVNYLFLLANCCEMDEDLENALFTYERILTIEPYNEKAKDSSQELRLKIKEQESLFTK
ncbi:MAG: tetratricopeptide repeat protein [Candidatus Peregrinibacteria bacterium]|nr:tetratricopeptide repeat protein [Candidatus Peregrinibacteria bacterium]